MSQPDNNRATTSPTRIALSWALVGVPLLYALYMTLLKTAPLFGG